MNGTINQRIALYRKLANLTQNETAEKMGMKGSTYSQMERKGNISAVRLRALADILGVKPETLMYEETDSSSDLSFSGEDSPVAKLNQSIPLAENAFNPPNFVVTHKEESIIKILRNLQKSDYDEVIDFINSKYKDSKKR